jgi:hypothetical protein
MESGLTASDVLALDRGEGVFGGSGSWVIILILFLMFAGGGWGGRGGDVATIDAIHTGFNDQTSRDILLSSANNNYETARLISEQTSAMLAQNNTNLINAIQGFNTVQSSIADLGAKLDTCCCSIKTMLLENRLYDAQAEVVKQANEISNAAQTQTILNALGKYVPTSNTPAA